MASKINSNDPLFIEALDVSEATLIPIKLVGSKNYRVWSRSNRIALLEKRKFGFVTGVYNKIMYREELHDQWKSCNSIVLSWLMSKVSVELLNGIIYAVLMKCGGDLKERINKVNRVRVYQLLTEINALT